MTYIKRLIEPEKLLLCWQATKAVSRSRFVVGELRVNEQGRVDLLYLKESDDFSAAVSHGFSGHPAFPLKGLASSHVDVLSTFLRRLPPKKRNDYPRYLELRGIAPDADISDFALLGYTGAKLPNDGFELVHPFTDIITDFQFIIEVAGFRHESTVSVDSVELNNPVSFVLEPDNEVDSNAICIFYGDNKIGYVCRGDTCKFHRLFDSKRQVSGRIFRKNGTPDRPLVYVYVEVSAATDTLLATG